MLRRCRPLFAGAIPAVYEEPKVYIKPDAPPPLPPKYRALICLAGCGVYDGAECTEAVAAAIALEQNDFVITWGAPYREQHHVIDHTKGAPAVGESRNIAVEAARIARAPPVDISTVDVKDYDCLILPGGFGVMKNLSNFAVAESAESAKVHDDVANLILSFYNNQKAIGAACIAPVIVAAVLGPEIKATKRPPIQLTLGETDGDAQRLAESFGSVELNECSVVSSFRDLHYNVVSTPAYMSEDASPASVFKGIERMAKDVRMILNQQKTGVCNVAV